tara:strand:+ start:247 stop:912 length:666 start_codon:yes stop_codon:yes gene_type:complete
MLKKVYKKLVFLIKKYVFFDKFLWAIHNWFKVRGDENLRINYDLNEKSIVFDVGGYKGDFTYEINKKYNCNIYIFEPMPEFYKIIKGRFEKQKNIKFFNFGLSRYDNKTSLFINDNASSVYSKTVNTTKEKIYLKSISEFIKAHNIDGINLLKLNIEGGEFEILESLIELQLISKISNLQIQFHDFVPNAIKRRESIRQNLSRTHKLTYDYYFVWENWILK